MNKVLIICLIAIAVTISGCKRQAVRAASQYVKAPTSLIIHSSIPYQEGNKIKANILNECALDLKLSKFLIEYGTENGLNIKAQENVTKDDNESVLMVEITDSVSSGSAFWGKHNKFTAIQGTLYTDGVKLASFTAGRKSSGGAFSEFKGSCAVLGRTVKRLGKDVASWLKKPWKKAKMGDI